MLVAEGAQAYLERMKPPSSRATNFLMGLGLVGLGVVDAAFNPFAFATAPQFFTAGVALMVAAQSSAPKKTPPRGKDGKFREDL